MTALDDALTTAPVRTTTAPARSTATVYAPKAHAQSAATRSTALDERTRWERRIRWILRASDATVAAAVCALATVIPVAESRAASIGLAAATTVVWLLMLSAFSTRGSAVLGSGATEYWRIAQATTMAFGVMAIVAVLLDLRGVRTLLLVALPIGLVLLIGSRWVWRRWLLRRRAQGTYVARTIVVGARDDVEHVVRTLGRRRLGYKVVGARLDDDDADGLRVDASIYPVLKSRSIAEAAETLCADTILVASRPAGDPDYVKRLAWQLERTAAELVLSSRIADVASPRMSLHAVEGLPMLHVKIPTFEGGAHLAKRALDVVASFGALIAFLPFAAVIALAIKLDSPGPVFFPQTRVGRDGHTFRMLKFRSMAVNAEKQRAALLSANEGAGPLFKMRNDPRITRVGRILRKYSLDEVPQFWNVLVGDMSVVGPRPPLPSEVSDYDGTVFRRLYIKPGITGPWQVSGRSNLTWDESVRLDLRYVENWSVTNDLVLMWRTVKVMVKPDGAY